MTINTNTSSKGTNLCADSEKLLEESSTKTFPTKKLSTCYRCKTSSTKIYCKICGREFCSRKCGVIGWICVHTSCFFVCPFYIFRIFREPQNKVDEKTKLLESEEYFEGVEEKIIEKAKLFEEETKLESVENLQEENLQESENNYQ